MMKNNYASLQKVIALIGMFLVVISLYCSFLLYTSFSNNLSDKAAWGGMGLGLDLFKNIALLAALALWTLGFFAARVLSIFVFLSYLVLTSISFMAFFGFMSTVQHQFERESMVAGSKYRSLQASLKDTEGMVKSLSRYADLSAVHQARTKTKEIIPQLEAEKRLMARYAHANCAPKRNSRGSPFTTKAAEHCARVDAINAQILPWREKIEGYEKYMAALAHQKFVLGEIEKLDAGSVEVNQSTLHPMFSDLGKLLAKAPDEMKVAFMFISSFSAEVLGTLSILIAILLGRRRSFTLDEIEYFSTQLKGHQQRLQRALAFTGTGPGQPALKDDTASTPKLASSVDGNPIKAKNLKPDAVTAVKKTPNPKKETKTEIIARQANEEDGKKQEEIIVEPHEKAPPFFIPKATAFRAAAGINIDKQFRPVTRAILNGKCLPAMEQIVERYKMHPALAGRYLAALEENGYLIFDACSGQFRLNNVLPAWQTAERDPRCSGIKYDNRGKPMNIFFNAARAMLPARLRSGDISWMRWGRRTKEKSEMPPGASTGVESIHAGKWDDYHPRPVLIPASGHMGKDRQGKTRWFFLDNNTFIQGLFAERKDEQRIYVVTMDAPPKFAHLSDRWPKLVRRDDMALALA